MKQSISNNMYDRSVKLIIDTFVFLMMLVFPLVFHDSYYDILQVKYQFYYLCTITMMVLLGILTMIYYTNAYISTRQTRQCVKTSRMEARKGWQKLSASDLAVTVFWLSCVISTFSSDYFFESFWGNEGRYNGLFLMTLYVLMYFVITRSSGMRNWYIQLFLISGMVVCSIGITDYFQMDILNFRTPKTMRQGMIFASTIGNINTYTSYIALITGVSATLFALSQKRVMMCWYYLCMMVSFVAITMGCSDSVYLALAVLFFFLPFLLFKSKKGMIRYLIVLASYLSIIVLIHQINMQYADIVLGLDSLFSVLARLEPLPYITAFLWLGVLVSCIARIRSKGSDSLGQHFVWIWAAFLVFVIACVCFIILDVNIFENVDKYGSLKRYLLFDDEWGTYRGFIWKKTISLYQELPFFQKLFGYGPDTFAILTTKTIWPEMLKMVGTYYDSVHNEYLHYLITIGPIGTISYIAFFVSSLIQLITCKQKNPVILSIFTAVSCYFVQAVVNINVPLVAPMVWLLLSLGVSETRK